MRYRLVLSDVDSTLIEQEVINQLADLVGEGAQVADITERAMRGEMDFESALRQRVALLAGLSEHGLNEVANALTYTSGARELIEHCKSNGIHVGAVSGGFIQVLAGFGLTAQLDFVRANTLEIKDGFLTGALTGEVIDRAAKARALRDFASEKGVPLPATMAIGDGANDLEMVVAAGLGVAFRAKTALREVADLAIEKSLAELIPLL